MAMEKVPIYEIWCWPRLKSYNMVRQKSGQALSKVDETFYDAINNCQKLPLAFIT